MTAVALPPSAASNVRAHRQVVAALFLVAAACQTLSILLPYFAGGPRLAADLGDVAFNAPVIVGWLAVAVLQLRERTGPVAAGLALAVTGIEASYLLRAIDDLRRGAAIGPGLVAEAAGVCVALLALRWSWRAIPVGPARLRSATDFLVPLVAVAAVVAWSVVQFLPAIRVTYRLANGTWGVDGPRSVSQGCCSTLTSAGVVSVAMTIAVALVIVVAVSMRAPMLQYAGHAGLGAMLGADALATAVFKTIDPPTPSITGMSDVLVHRYGVAVTAGFTSTYWIGVAAIVVVVAAPVLRRRWRRT